MRGIFLILVGSAISIQAFAADIALGGKNSGSKDVDALVLQLVSTRPAPHPSGYWLMTLEEEMAVPYMTPQVSNAIATLKMMGTTIFPALVKHLVDDRYSFSTIVAAWDNCTVGDAVLEVLSDGHQMFSGYKSRKTPSGSAVYLSFRAYLRDREPEKLAAWAKDRNRLEIQLDFIDWCVAKEEKRGFIDEAQRKHLIERYAEAREQVRNEYSEPSGAANRSQPVRSETNRTPAAAGSGR